MAFRRRVDSGLLLSAYWVNTLLKQLEANISPEKKMLNISTCYCWNYFMDQYNRSEQRSSFEQVLDLFLYPFQMYCTVYGSFKKMEDSRKTKS